MSHTPTPFEVRQHSDTETLVVLPKVSARPGRFIARVYGADPEQRLVDAEFIATACNNHDALVAALADLAEGHSMGRAAHARKLLKGLK